MVLGDGTPVYMYTPHTSVPSPGTPPKADDSHIQSPMTFWMSTHCKGNLNSIDEQLFSQYLVRGNPK
jgi:hypothetical protein